jgi:hypothetical protein
MLLQESKGPKERDLSDKIIVNAEIRALNSTETLKPRASRSAPSWRQTRAMIDSGSSFDIIDPFLAKQLNLQVKPLPRPIAKYLDGSNPTVYGQTSLELRITDQNRQFRHQVAQLLVMDSPDYPMLLGMPWLRRWNPIPDFRAKTISFQDHDSPEYSKIALISAEELAAELETGTSQLYVCSIGSVSPQGDRSGALPPEFKDYEDVFSKEKAAALAAHGPQDLQIELIPGAQPPFRPLYNMSEAELVILRQYIQKYLQRGWIRTSRSPAGAPILFVKKPNGSLRLCVDYRGLNAVTIKNRHPLPLIEESLDRLSQARYFTRLDIRDAYHRLRIKEGDEWKTAFRTRYGHFEYLVVPFGLTNAPAAFQAFINRCMTGLMDIICVIYLDDILIYSKDRQQHVKDVKTVLERLREFKLYASLEKSEFFVDRTEFLGYIVTPDGVTIDPERTKTIREWPEPRTVGEVRSFIGFINFYRRFIPKFSGIAAPLHELTRKGPHQARKGPALRREEKQRITLPSEAKIAFQALKDAFTNTPIVAHFDPSRPTRLETDASASAISGILSQLVLRRDGVAEWRPIAFYSRKTSSAEHNYDTHDVELLAIIESLKHWRRFLQGLQAPFEVLTDHGNLKGFAQKRDLSQRQRRWSMLLQEYTFIVIHRPGSQNPADKPSRRADYVQQTQLEAGRESDAQWHQLMAKLGLNGSQRDAVAQVSKDGRATGRRPITRSLSKAQPKGAVGQRGLDETAKGQKGSSRGSSWSSIASSESDLPIRGTALKSVGKKSLDEIARGPSMRRDAPSASDLPQEAQPGATSQGQEAPERRSALKTDAERRIVLEMCHCDPLAGHFGYKRTLEKVRRHYTWATVRRDVKEFVDACLACRQSKAARHAPYGLLRPLPVPDGPWEDLTMDFITDLPPSRVGEDVFDSIMVIVDKLTKMAHYIPVTKKIGAKELALLFLREVVRLHGVPRSITSDRGPVLVSAYWKEFCKALSIRSKASTAFHPQTDGQTERQNQTLEQYLRVYCCFEQDDWAIWLNTAEFAYNDSVHASTGVTPFVAYTGRHPRGGEWPLTAPKRDMPDHKHFIAKMIEIQKYVRAKLTQAQAYQAKFYDRWHKKAQFAVNDLVMLNTRNIRSIRPKKKLDKKFEGPFRITEVINPQAYRLNLPKGIGIYNAFHVSLLEPYKASERFPAKIGPLWNTLDLGEPDIYEVEEILDERLNQEGFWEYKIKWKGYPMEECTWEVAAQISRAAMSAYRNKKRKRRLAAT